MTSASCFLVVQWPYDGKGTLLGVGYFAKEP